MLMMENGENQMRIIKATSDLFIMMFFVVPLTNHFSKT